MAQDNKPDQAKLDRDKAEALKHTLKPAEPSATVEKPKPDDATLHATAGDASGNPVNKPGMSNS